MGDSKTLILIDGHALAFRQYYALERTNMRTNNGTPTWAVYGFFKAIFDLLKKQKPDAICVAFDVSHQTFRVEKFSEYKANRQAMPDNMRCQMDLIYEGLEAFNIPIYTKEGYEADDVIGTISKKACELGHKVLILTGDQDSFQLIDKNGCTKVIIPQKSDLIEFDWHKVYDKLGVYPNQVVDYKSLRGDTSDNIPGVKGIGEKTAIKLLSEFGSLENILANCDSLEPQSVKQKLCADIDMAKLSYFLATIVCDVDIDFDFESAKVEVPDISLVSNFLKKMQFLTFLKNIDSILSTFNISSSSDVETCNNDVSENNQMQLGLFSDVVSSQINKSYEHSFSQIKDVNDLNNLINLLNTKSLIAFKSDFISVNAVENEIRGLTLAFSDGYKYKDQMEFDDVKSSYEIFHISFADFSSSSIFPLLKQILENDNLKKVTYDLKSELNLWRSYNIALQGAIFDVNLASYVKDMSRNHSLSSQALENLDIVIKDPNDKDDKSDLTLNLPIINVDAVSQIIISIFELTKYWMNNLDQDELKILFDIEIPLTYVLSDMEFSGVSINKNYLIELSDSMNMKLRRLERKIYDLADESFNVSSPKQVAYILFDKLGLTIKGKKKKSTSAAVLEELAEEYEIANLILEYRKFAKLKSTYTDTLPELVSYVDQRIHTTYNQTVTATGRLSSSNPNLQNIPVRTKYGAKIRKAFVSANTNEQLILSADYSQIELRLLAHISQDKNLIEAFKSGLDVHTLIASKVFDVPVADVTKEMRYKAKAVNFGIVYGQSKYGLAKSLGISNNEAGEFIDKYFATYPKVKKYMNNKVIEAETNGFVTSLFGRKRYLTTEFNSPNAMVREFAKRAAINYPMQSSASDLIKIAMIDLKEKMKNLKSKLIMQVHDELVIEVYKDELEQIKDMVKTSMELGQPLDVPLLVDVTVGESW